MDGLILFPLAIVECILLDDDDEDEGKSPNNNLANALPVFDDNLLDTSCVNIPQVANFVLPEGAPLLLPPPSTMNVLHSKKEKIDLKIWNYVKICTNLDLRKKNPDQ